MKNQDSKTNQSGFTLMELMVVMAILMILTGIALLYLNDFLKTSRDSAALVDAKNLMVVVNNNFLDGVSADYSQTNTNGEIGLMDADDANPRKAIYRLSPGVQIDFKAGYSNKSYGDTRNSSFAAYLHNVNGTKVPANQILIGFPFRAVELIIDEGSGVQEFYLR